ncbi:ATP-binding protein [Calothrix sp. FACHB-156]|nr:ATP-binding protein [Calothrix sp. FACHB-156]
MVNPGLTATDHTGKTTSRPPQGSVDSPDLNGLQPLLQLLDQRLAQAIASIHTEDDPKPHPYQGLLHPEPEAVEQLLTSKPGEPRFQNEDEPSVEFSFVQIPPDSPLAWLQQTFGLSAFDLEVVAIAIAPEIDRRYEQLYAYLQDDVRCKCPTIDLALNLLCPSAPAKLKQRSRFASNAPLLQQGLLHLIPDQNQSKPTFLSYRLYLNDQVIHLLLSQPGLDERLTPFCELMPPKASLTNKYIYDKQLSLSLLIGQNWQANKPLRLYFQGVDQANKRRTAEALASEVNAPLLVVDLAKMVDAKVSLEPIFKLIVREAWFQNALLYIDSLDILQEKERSLGYHSLLNAIAQHHGITILAGVQAWVPTHTEPLGILTIHFALPNFTQSRAYWQTHLVAAGIAIAQTDLDSLADRFCLTPDQIGNVVATVCNQMRWRDASSKASEQNQIHNSKFVLQQTETFLTPQVADLFAAARAQSGHDLRTLARRIEPKYSWNEIILPPNQLTQLQELCNQAKYKHIVYGEWGFADKLSLGKGLNVLFSGQPGTGKTMAAEVIAHELQLDLYKIDLSQIVSKYIGETEKNLNRIFTAAANSNAILLFDEADALFGKRSEVRDARDRYANIEIGYLLQKMEEYEGIAILTTNVQSNMDSAFVRRLRFIIEFPLPNEQDRRRIWEQIWPNTTPLSPELNLDLVAHRFEITGANIRNIALAAAFLAADQGEMINMSHLIRAIRREYQKMGKLLMEDLSE